MVEDITSYLPSGVHFYFKYYLEYIINKRYKSTRGSKHKALRAFKIMLKISLLFRYFCFEYKNTISNTKDLQFT